MGLQYLSDSKGETTGVFIPITEWNELKLKYEELSLLDIPAWQMQEVAERMEAYRKAPQSASNADEFLDALERQP
jgi:phage pi2 protein 07